MKYKGYSYWNVLGNPKAQKWWKRVFCPMGWHLWDEVETWPDGKPEHYLVCDACDEEIAIVDKHYWKEKNNVRSRQNRKRV